MKRIASLYYRFGFLSVLFVMVLLVCISLPCMGNADEKGDQLFEKGLKYLEKGDLQRAYESFSAAAYDFQYEAMAAELGGTAEDRKKVKEKRASAYFNMGITAWRSAIQGRDKWFHKDPYAAAYSLFCESLQFAAKGTMLRKKALGMLEGMKGLVDPEIVKEIGACEPIAKGEEVGRDGPFIAYSDGTVLDTRTNLMWAAKDNGYNVTWSEAKVYCDGYRGGGYTDWRMPTISELERLYNIEKSYKAKQRYYKVHLTGLISLTACCPWASGTLFSRATYFSFINGEENPSHLSFSYDSRALPVRSGKK